MRSRSPIFSSKACFLAVFLVTAALPTALVDLFVVPKLNGLITNSEMVHMGLDRLAGRKVVILGESTIRALDPNPMEIEREQDFANLALPGGGGRDALEVMRMAFEKPNDVRLVLYGTAMSGAINKPSQFSGYLPSLLPYGRIFNAWKRGEMGWEAALDISLRRLIPLLNGKSDVRDHYLKYVSSEASTFLRIMDLSLATEKIPILRQESTPLEEIAKIAREHGARFVLFFSPFESHARGMPVNKKNHDDFLALCGNGIECWDLSEALPDEGFAGDGYHMRDEQVLRFRALLLHRAQAAMPGEPKRSFATEPVHVP